MLEVVVSLTLGVVILTFGAAVTVNLWTAVQVLRKPLEDDASWQVLLNALRLDAHSARQVQCSSDALYLTELNGMSIRYAVNSNHEVVRVLANGGTEVVAVQVNQWQCATDTRGGLHVSITFLDGTMETVWVPLFSNLHIR